MYQTIIDQLKYEAIVHARAVDWCRAYNYRPEREVYHRTQQMTYLSVIDILRLIDGQDLRMNQEVKHGT